MPFNLPTRRLQNTLETRTRRHYNHLLDRHRTSRRRADTKSRFGCPYLTC